MKGENEPMLNHLGPWISPVNLASLIF